MKVGVHEFIALSAAELQMQLVRCELQRILRHLPEIRITIHRHAQPGVFKLAGSPLITQCRATFGEKLFRQGKDGRGSKMGKASKAIALMRDLKASFGIDVSIEGNTPKAMLLPASPMNSRRLNTLNMFEFQW